MFIFRRSDSAEMFSLALFLAEKYNLDVYKVVTEHVLTLLTICSSPHKLLESQIKESCVQLFTAEVLTR